MQAAGMSLLWFLALFVPLLNLISFVLWCVRIVRARGKSFIVSILLILPITNPLAFLYLAFSSSASSPIGAPRKFRTMALRTA
jgi:hypothetical protein